MVTWIIRVVNKVLGTFACIGQDIKYRGWDVMLHKDVGKVIFGLLCEVLIMLKEEGCH